jgi:hypothetical protein
MMARTITIEIDDKDEAEAARMREVWGMSEAAFWRAALSHGLDTVAALQHGEAVEAQAIGPGYPVKPTPADDDLPF